MHVMVRVLFLALYLRAHGRNIASALDVRNVLRDAFCQVC
jgi:hypothetical protein